MDTMLPVVIISVLTITLSAIHLLRPLAGRFHLLDVPNHRKLHHGSIPLIGGIAMFCGIALTTLFVMPWTTTNFVWLLSALIIVGMGALDDAQDISVRSRLVVQALVTLLLCYGSGLYLADLGNLFGLGEIHLGGLGYLVTALAVIGAINAFNMMDGIDGLAGSMALVSFGGLAVLFGVQDNTYGVHLALLFIIALLPYLAVNLGFPPFKQKIFMGDAGAMLIGLTVVWLLIYGTQNTSPTFRPVTALWLVAGPLMDMAAIMVRRIRRGESPFKPDRDHLHHIMMRLGFSPIQALAVMTGTAALFAAVGLVGEWLQVPEVLMFVSFLLVFGAYSYGLKHAWKLMKVVHKLGHHQKSEA